MTVKVFTDTATTWDWSMSCADPQDWTIGTVPRASVSPTGPRRTNSWTLAAGVHVTNHVRPPASAPNVEGDDPSDGLNGGTADPTAYLSANSSTQVPPA